MNAIRRRGAVLGASVPAVQAVAAGLVWLALQPSDAGQLAIVVALIAIASATGVVPGAWIGWTWAPYVLSETRSGPRTASRRMVAWSVLIGDAEISLLLTAAVLVASLVVPGAERPSLLLVLAAPIAAFAYLFLIGMLIFGVPAALVAWWSIEIWGRLLRRGGPADRPLP